MTGGYDGNGHLVIPLPWVKPEFGSSTAGHWLLPMAGRVYLSPIRARRWRLLLTAPSTGIRFSKPSRVRTFQGPVSPLAVVRPAERTFGWWVEEWPYREPSVFRWPGEAELPRSYHRDRVYWRLVVELIARWEAGDLVVKGRRTDVSTSEVEEVKRGLLRDPFMFLRPRHPGCGGLFGPEEWQRRQPPTTLPELYCELTVWPAKAAEAKQKARPRVPYPKLLHWWTEVYLPQHPDPDKRPNADTQRTDAAAAFPDHSPPTARTMQTLRATREAEEADARAINAQPWEPPPGMGAALPGLCG